METRTLEQVKVWKLILNPMTSNCEVANIVALSPNKEELIKWVKDQLAPEPYLDERWSKVFKKGSPLEWYNNVLDLEAEPDYYDQGISSEWTTINNIHDYVEQSKISYTTVPELIGLDY